MKTTGYVLKKYSLLRNLSLLALMCMSAPAFTAELTPNITLDTDVKLQASNLDNADLGTAGSDNDTSGAVETRFRLNAKINENVRFYWDGRAVLADDNGGFQTTDTGRVSTDGSFLEWRQSYFEFENLGGTPASMKIGRQKFREEYGLWWNRDFDAVRLAYETTLFKGFIAGGQDLFSYSTEDDDFDNNEQDIARVFAEGSWQYYYQQFLEARVLFEDDHSGINLGDPANPADPDDRDGQLFWAGIRATGNTAAFFGGEAKPTYRLDLMGVRGNEDVATIGGGVIAALADTDVSGWAFDGAIDIPLPNASPIIRLGYAYGSGDDNLADNDDDAFRQSRMAGNFSRFGALSENTDNYGTVLRPELSNIHVLSAGVSMPVLEASNIGAVYRYYRLNEPAGALTASGVNNVLNGTDRDLGHGVDILFNSDILKEANLGFNRVEDVSLRSSLGFFRSGDAFGAADDEIAVRGLVEVKVGF